MKLFTTVLRVLVGGLFVGHGTQKLFGWFGGHGPDGTGQFFESIGITPGKEQALAAGAAEAGGGALLALGLATPLGAAGITGAMVQAIRTVHGSKGPWAQEGGWEYNAVLIAAVLALVEQGGFGLGREFKGPGWALAALAGGAAGPELVNRFVLPQLAPPAEPQPAAPAA